MISDRSLATHQDAPDICAKYEESQCCHGVQEAEGLDLRAVIREVRVDLIEGRIECCDVACGYYTKAKMEPTYTSILTPAAFSLALV